ncbi:MAG: hypothetical protein HOO98_05885 [Nitrospira sp.]|nr:hypothetical protein [Nitrospira sp.]
MTIPKLTTVHWSNTMLRRLFPLAVLTGLSLAGALLICVYGLRPAEEQLLMAERAYQNAKQIQADLQRTKIQQVRAQAAQRQLDIVRQALPTQEEFTPLALALSELAKREHIIIPGMGYDIKKPEDGRPVKATVTFKATGEYAAMYRFLHRLETADHYLVIESLDVAGEQKQDASAARVVVNFTVATYLRQTIRRGGSL